MKTKLNLAFLHLSVKYADMNSNHQKILEMVTEASTAGSDFIVAPEMATSGYAFDNPQHAAFYTENLNGKFIYELKNLCIKNCCWVCIGMPLCGENEFSVYNGAVIIDDTGKIRCIYHKVTAEKTWAAQGRFDPYGVVSTPWGKIGVLICSDSTIVNR
jgi:predicted amidohydrolase